MAQMYYLNDGVYGSFNCTIFDHWVVDPKPFLIDDTLDERQNYLTTIWGPTCDSMDCIKRDVVMPEMHIGEWVLFKEMGAYTICAGSQFNGFKLPALQYYVPVYTLEMLQHLPNWSRICSILEIEEEETTHMDVYDLDHSLEMITVHWSVVLFALDIIPYILLLFAFFNNFLFFLLLKFILNRF